MKPGFRSSCSRIAVTNAVDADFLEIGMSEYNTPATVGSWEATELEWSLSEESDELEELVGGLVEFDNDKL